MVLVSCARGRETRVEKSQISVTVTITMESRPYRIIERLVSSIILSAQLIGIEILNPPRISPSA